MISYGENIFRPTGSKQSAYSKESVLETIPTTAEECFDSLISFLQLSKPNQSWQIRQSSVMKQEAVGTGQPIFFIAKTNEIQDDVPVFINYFQTRKGSEVELVYSYQVRLKQNWYHAHVNAQNGKVEAIIDWTADASAYKVLPINAIDIEQDKRRMIKAHPDRKASPHGWHSNGRRLFRDTRGNNVWAQQNTYAMKTVQNLYRPSGDYRRVFNFPFDAKSDPRRNRDASITQLFYTINVLHDILYQYGFDEVAGNFQDNNGNKSGLGNDFVIANAFDETSYNNAYFSTSPDGQSGIMGMFLWYETFPSRDVVFDVGVITHEYGHGLSNRLTGGPNDVDCLSTMESGGLGEGWSDVLAIVLQQKVSNKRTDTFPSAVYVNNGVNIRKYVYSTNLTINPSLFSYIDQSEEYNEVHRKGEVWAVILLEVYWNLIDILGFTSDVYSASLTKGNTLFLQVMITAMKLQPCNPTFIQARDAFLDAERSLTNGTYVCPIWAGFAKRGLGYNAQKMNDKATDGFQVPPKCR